MAEPQQKSWILCRTVWVAVLIALLAAANLATETVADARLLSWLMILRELLSVAVRRITRDPMTFTTTRG